MARSGEQVRTQKSAGTPSDAHKTDSNQARDTPAPRVVGQDQCGHFGRDHLTQTTWNDCPKGWKFSVSCRSSFALISSNVRTVSSG